jgi:hypothetical protein
MGIQITVISGKNEPKKGGVGILKQADDEKAGKHAELSLAELVNSVLAEVGTGIVTETEIEIEVTGIVELINKEDKVSATFDIGSETPGSRTMKLKLKTTVKPK